jgi:guanylate kinase
MRSSSVTKTPRTPILLLITAPSGAGKTTLCQNLMEAEPSVHRVITCTTRPPRGNEINGVDYHFLDKSDFELGIVKGDFLEHAVVYDNLYGTRKNDISKQFEAGHDVLLNIDVQGAESVRDQAVNEPNLKQALVTVFMTPPSLDELEKRLRNRNTDNEETIQKRLEHARHEIKEWTFFNYLIISGSMDEDLQKITSIIQAERVKADRLQLPNLNCIASQGVSNPTPSQS